jgi:hypothetical protein
LAGFASHDGRRCHKCNAHSYAPGFGAALCTLCVGPESDQRFTDKEGRTCLKPIANACRTGCSELRSPVETLQTC